MLGGLPNFAQGNHLSWALKAFSSDAAFYLKWVGNRWNCKFIVEYTLDKGLSQTKSCVLLNCEFSVQWDEKIGQRGLNKIKVQDWLRLWNGALWEQDLIFFFCLKPLSIWAIGALGDVNVG